ncbi:MAG TPA: TolC family protein [Thermoanaerobaculia bacterium]|jgi:cobalt-zinc-cadmium efflux system outer membrane protein|nr:TolC family protein [Thermoanaerobaculia bacterium]
MRAPWLHGFVAASSLALSACASAPRDVGLSEVQSAVVASSGQQLVWDPQAPIDAPSSDAAIQPLLAEPITANRAVEIAFRNNRDLLATLENLGIARADLLQARTIRNPFFEAEIRFPEKPKAPFEVVLMQPLFDLLRLRARRAAGEAAFEVTRLRITGAVLAFASEVRNDFYTEQAARQVLARQTAITETARTAAELAQRQHEAGNISDLDLESEQARYETAKLALARASLDELQARERLIADLGLVDPKTQLDVPPELPPIPSEDPPVTDLDRALAGRLDLTLARAELATARASLPLAKAPLFENVAAGAHHEREPEGTRTTGPALELPIPIFDTGRARRDRALAMIRQAEQRLYALDLAGRSAARAAAERLREARARAEYLRDVVVPRRQRIVALLQLENNAMLRGVFDLIRARQDYDQAARDQVLAQRDYWVARTELQAALGGVRGFSVRPETNNSRPLPLFQARDQQTKENE